MNIRVLIFLINSKLHDSIAGAGEGKGEQTGKGPRRIQGRAGIMRGS